MKNILITGVAGFIGSKVSKLFLDEGFSVIGVDNFHTGSRTNIDSRIKFFEFDLSKKKYFSQVDFSNIDAIFHIAGQSGGMPSWDDPSLDLEFNTISTLNLIEIAIQYNIKNFVYFSSMAVYGDNNFLPVIESSNLNPKTPYGVSKLTSETYLKLFENHFNNIIVLRLNNIYGPGQDFQNLTQGMVSIYIGQAYKNKNILVKGSVDRFRDFVFIDDLLDLMMKIINKTSEEVLGYRIFNVSSGVKTTVNELLDSILRNLPYKVDIEVDGDTRGDQFGIYCSNNLINETFSWKTKHSLESGIKLTIDSLFKAKKH